MRLESVLLLVATGTVVSTVTLTSPAVSDAVWKYRNGEALKGADFTALRREALTLMPRGSRLREAEKKLTAIGFVCAGTPHSLPNINGASLICGSAGRGYPSSPQVNLTIVSRNGLISDVEVWNLFETADAAADLRLIRKVDALPAPEAEPAWPGGSPQRTSDSASVPSGAGQRPRGRGT